MATPSLGHLSGCPSSLPTGLRWMDGELHVLPTRSSHLAVLPGRHAVRALTPHTLVFGLPAQLPAMVPHARDPSFQLLGSQNPWCCGHRWEWASLACSTWQCPPSQLFSSQLLSSSEAQGPFSQSTSEADTQQELRSRPSFLLALLRFRNNSLGLPPPGE